MKITPYHQFWSERAKEVFYTDGAIAQGCQFPEDGYQYHMLVADQSGEVLGEFPLADYEVEFADHIDCLLEIASEEYYDQGLSPFLTVSDISREFGVSKTLVYQWKRMPGAPERVLDSAPAQYRRAEVVEWFRMRRKRRA